MLNGDSRSKSQILLTPNQNDTLRVQALDRSFFKIKESRTPLKTRPVFLKDTGDTRLMECEATP